MQWSVSNNRGSALAGQFATPEWVARVLCSRLRKTPKIVADLGVGRGALSMALLNRFPNVPIIGIDKHAVPRGDRSAMKAEGVQIVTRDVGSANFSIWFRSQFGGVDTAVSNPPFTYIENKPSIEALLMKNGLGNSKGAKNQRLDLVFLSHAKNLLNPDGEMAFILPISAFAMAKTLAHLQMMADQFGLEEIIMLPSNSYHGAEVDTAILIFRPKGGASSSKKFALYSAKSEGEIDLLGRFSPSKFDFDVGIKCVDASNENTKTLSSFGAKIARGKHSSNALMTHGVSHFHTTSFQDYPTAYVDFKQAARSVDAVDEPAQEGDILIARVGTRCLGRAVIVVSGKQQISDCVFRISPPPSKRRKIWEFISSEAGRSWQLSLARGACAKFITQQDLLSAPLPPSIQW